jgi:hypothetical protein
MSEQQSSADSAKPVAWRWRYTSETLWRYRSGRPSFPTDGAGVQCEPLYDRPAPDAEPQTAAADDAIDFGRANSALHKALRVYPEAFNALHYFWNEAIAGQPQSQAESDGDKS